jgi:hypothetical protein
MVALKGSEITSVRIIDAISHQKLVKRKDQAVLAASAVGVSFGTENL